MHDARGDVRGVAGLEDALLLFDPLLHLAGEDVDHLLELGVRVESVAFARGQGSFADLQVLGPGQLGSGQPVIGTSFILFLDGLGLGHETQGFAHTGSYASWSHVSKPEGEVVDRGET